MKNRTRKKRHDAATHARIMRIKDKLAALSPAETSELILNFFEGGPFSASEIAWLRAGYESEPQVDAQRRG
ncbi:MAG: hypothetical protein HYS18_11555 [Burkholderiales bacterium]|nr:hypothetical protein [Burkholderiales bacterium]